MRITGLIFALALFSFASFAQTDTEEGFFSDGPTGDKPPQAASPVPDEKPTTRSTISDPSTAESHPFYDWSKHKGETEIKDHPLAEKGLIEVTRDRTYIYTVKHSDQKHAGSLFIGYMDPKNLHNPENPGDTFENNYGGGNVYIDFAYEWQIWKMPIGKIGITAGAGMFFAQGHGHFTHPEKEPQGLTPKETFSLAVIPLEGGGVYRLQIWDKQLIVPYGGGGLALIPFTEMRDDGKAPKFGGSAAVYFNVGAALNMTYFDRFASLTLDREYGINRVYLTGEFRQYLTLSSRFDFSSPVPGAGFAAEF